MKNNTTTKSSCAKNNSGSGTINSMAISTHLKLPTVPVKRQHENKVLWNENRSTDGADFFTIGYSGRTTEEVLNALVENGVRTLVDIRQNPVSMYRPDLSKGNLSRSIEELGMHYVHLPELGVPRDIRAKAIGEGTRDVIWDWYDVNVVQSYVGRNLHKFLNTFEHPVAMMCTEIDPHECHRHRLFIALEEMGLKGFDL